MIIYDFEVFKYDWMVAWLDTETKKMHHIINNKSQLEKMYKHYENRVWVGYNSRNYDQWVLKTILADLDPFAITDWIINKDQKGYMFSRMLSKFPLLNYDCSHGFRSLKECEAFMGHEIKESSVPFDIDRKLTNAELNEVLKYCKHDVMETFEVFIQDAKEYNSHVGLIKEFKLGIEDISKTKAQISAKILGARKTPRDDEFDIRFAETIELGQYDHLKQSYLDWAERAKEIGQEAYKEPISAEVAGVPHIFSFGGLHGARPKYFGEGDFIMADVASYYPAIMIIYDMLSRNVSNPERFVAIRDERLIMKATKDPREGPRKIVINGTFGASKDEYNALYDPLQANNVCINGQLMLADLIDKLEDKCMLIQSNTDGILIKINPPYSKEHIIAECDKWSARTGMNLDFDKVTKVFQKDVNNYIIVYDNGYVKSKGAWVKELSSLDYHLPIVNKAIKDYFIHNIPVERTIMKCNELIEFQFVTKTTGKYDYAFKEHTHGGCRTLILGEHRYVGGIVQEKVNRVFASTDYRDGGLSKKSKKKMKLDKTPSTPDKCRIVNTNIVGHTVPDWLDKNWYIDLAKERVAVFIGS